METEGLHIRGPQIIQKRPEIFRIQHMPGTGRTHNDGNAAFPENRTACPPQGEQAGVSGAGYRPLLAGLSGNPQQETGAGSFQAAEKIPAAFYPAPRLRIRRRLPSTGPSVFQPLCKHSRSASACGTFLPPRQ